MKAPAEDINKKNTALFPKKSVNLAKTTSVAGVLNALFSNMSPVPLEQVIIHLLEILNSYPGVATFPDANPADEKIESKRASLTASEMEAIKKEDYWRYSQALEQTFPTFKDTRFSFVPAHEYKQINVADRDKRKISGYLLLRFHIEKIRDFIDLMCFRDVLIQVAPSLRERGFHLRNNFGETINNLLAYLQSQHFQEMNKVKLLCEQHLPIFIKRFIDHELKNKEPYVENGIQKDKKAMQEVLDLIELTPSLERRSKAQSSWLDKFFDRITVEDMDLVLHSMDLNGYCDREGLLIPHPILKFYYYFRHDRGYEGRGDLSNKFRNLFAEFDQLFSDKPHIIKSYLNQFAQMIHHKFPDLIVKFELDYLNKIQQIDFLHKNGCSFFTRSLVALVADYVGSNDVDIKESQSLTPL